MPFNLRDMAAKTQAMLKESLDALVNRDAALAYRVCAADEEVDNLNRQAYTVFLEAVEKNPARLKMLLHQFTAMRQLERIAGFTQLKRGITVNPGVISGGTRVNVVPAEARAEVDMRVVRLRDAPALEKKFRALRPLDKRCAIEVAGGLNRPPMERTPGVVRLFRMAQALGREMGVELGESLSGGGSDGNFSAALGIPTLDGLGAVGEGAHAVNESIRVNRIADRTALIAKLLAAL